MGGLYRTSIVSELLGIHPIILRRWIRAGKVNLKRVGSSPSGPKANESPVKGLVAPVMLSVEANSSTTRILYSIS